MRERKVSTAIVHGCQMCRGDVKLWDNELCSSITVDQQRFDVCLDRAVHPGALSKDRERTLSHHHHSSSPISTHQLLCRLLHLVHALPNTLALLEFFSVSFRVLLEILDNQPLQPLHILVQSCDHRHDHVADSGCFCHVFDDTSRQVHMHWLMPAHSALLDLNLTVSTSAGTGISMKNSGVVLTSSLLYQGIRHSEER